jgi:large subunit ribosomal protein L47
MCRLLNVHVEVEVDVNMVRAWLTNENQVKKTQKSIKQVLTERYYSWQDAQDVAKSDAEVDLSGEGPAYTPSDYFVEDEEVAADAGKAPEARP